MDLYTSLSDLVSAAQCDFFGVADLALAREFVDEQGGEIVAPFPRAISIGIALPNAIVDLLPQRSNHTVAVQYRSHAYDVINQRLNEVASQAASLVQRAGHRVMPISAADRTDAEGHRAVFSHKLAAHLAGLGWIGKSCLLVTPQVGPRVRWISVLTEAPLPIGEPMEERCGECRECVEVCPVQAFSGRPFREEDPRSVRYHAAKCDEYLDEEKHEGGMRVCGMCLYICPHGRKLPGA